ARAAGGGGGTPGARACAPASRSGALPTGFFSVRGSRVVVGPAGAAAAARPADVDKPRPGPTAVAPPPRRAAAPRGEDWPWWRGPRADGTWRGPPLPDRWPPAGPRRLWRQPVGGGYAGVAAAAGRVVTLDY